jgi:hypothetical protein
VGFCFGHAMPKACQHAMNDTKFCEGTWEVSLKNAHVASQQRISWIKKYNKSRQKWDKACIEVELPIWKLKTSMKTQVANKVVLFQKTLEYANAINLCY